MGFAAYSMCERNERFNDKIPLKVFIDRKKWELESIPESFSGEGTSGGSILCLAIRCVTLLLVSASPLSPLVSTSSLSKSTTRSITILPLLIT
ncbi:hypothetical protein P8452_54028 [Trifolium repens]|nr:hypothetical protein P8452_54028 [Trifolium repens]